MDNVDEKVEFLTNSISLLLDLHAPIVTYRITKPYAPWLTDTIKIMMIDRDKALKKYKKTNDVSHWKTYKDLRNAVTTTIRREKKAFCDQKFVNKNKKDIWSSLNILGVNKNKKSCNLPDNLTNVTDLNNYFINSVPKLPPDQSTIDYYQNNLKSSVTRLLTFHPITEIDVFRIINSINSEATGADGINILTIRLCIPFLLPYITHIVNFCLVNSVFPTSWKTARVIPLPKVLNPTSLNHVRPISILPTFSKILENAIKEQLQEHLQQNLILPTNQSGFKSGHSCTTALLNISDDVFDAIDKNKLTALILLDYTKAFDTLNHKILYSIFNFIGLTYPASNLLLQYLTDRSQAVVYRNNISNVLTINAGVPQGSVLGPIFFTIYTCNFPTTFLSCTQHYFADDTQIYLNFDLQDSIQAIAAINYDLTNLAKYSEHHCLKLNGDKTTAIVFGRKGDRNEFLEIFDRSLYINNSVIKFTDCVKNLGLYMDCELRFTEHVNKSLQKAYINLKLIYQNRHILNTPLKCMLCDSLVLSQLNYCDILYGPCLSSVDSGKIQKL